ncbi:MAG: hypothetical protein OJF47_001172 [Nitrospira sp.]|jgi:hypothetical protein|nr:MAG: hypothetical protein OJF47_001172 [Nitrospira sp.]
MPSSTLDSLVESYCATSEANQRRLAHLADLLTLFAQQRLDVMLLKGGDLLSRLYEVRGTRPLADIDLLVREEDVDAIDRLLRAQGFEPQIDGNPAYCSVKSGLLLDITTSLWFLTTEQLRGLWNRTVPRSVEPGYARVMATEDLLLYLTAYCVVHRGYFSPTFFQDLALLIEKDRPDWNLVIERAIAWHLTMPLLHGLSMAGRSPQNPPIPEEVFSRLAPTGWWQPRLLAILRRLVTHHAIPELGHFLLVVTQPPNRWVDRLRHVFFPSPAFLAYRYGPSGPRNPVRTKLQRIVHLLGSGTVLAWRIAVALLIPTGQEARS